MSLLKRISTVFLLSAFSVMVIVFAKPKEQNVFDMSVLVEKIKTTDPYCKDLLETGRNKSSRDIEEIKKRCVLLKVFDKAYIKYLEIDITPELKLSKEEKHLKKLELTTKLSEFLEKIFKRKLFKNIPEFLKWVKENRSKFYGEDYLYMAKQACREKETIENLQIRCDMHKYCIGYEYPNNCTNYLGEVFGFGNYEKMPLKERNIKFAQVVDSAMEQFLDERTFFSFNKLNAFDKCGLWKLASPKQRKKLSKIRKDMIFLANIYDQYILETNFRNIDEDDAEKLRDAMNRICQVQRKGQCKAFQDLKSLRYTYSPPVESFYISEYVDQIDSSDSVYRNFVINIPDTPSGNYIKYQIKDVPKQKMRIFENSTIPGGRDSKSGIIFLAKGYTIDDDSIFDNSAQANMFIFEHEMIHTLNSKDIQDKKLVELAVFEQEKEPYLIHMSEIYYGQSKNPKYVEDIENLGQFTEKELRKYISKFEKSAHKYMEYIKNEIISDMPTLDEFYKKVYPEIFEKVIEYSLLLPQKWNELEKIKKLDIYYGRVYSVENILENIDDFKPSAIKKIYKSLIRLQDYKDYYKSRWDKAIKEVYEPTMALAK